MSTHFTITHKDVEDFLQNGFASIVLGPSWTLDIGILDFIHNKVTLLVPLCTGNIY